MVAPVLDRAISEEARLAEQFLSTLRDPRAPRAAAYESFGDEHGLGPELRRATRIAVLKIRVFGAAEAHARRGRR